MLEDLFVSRGQRDYRSFGFRGGEINKFSISESEGGSDEVRVEIFEVVMEIIVFYEDFVINGFIKVIVFGIIIENVDEGDEEEVNNSVQFQEVGLEFFFGVFESIKVGDDGEINQENGYLYCRVSGLILELDCEGGDDNFEWQDESLLEEVVLIYLRISQQ